MTRKQFDEAAEALAAANPTWALGKILAMPGGYDAFPKHLKDDLHRRLKVTPEIVFFKQAGHSIGGG